MKDGKLEMVADVAFDQGKLDMLTDALIKALPEASNIRHLKGGGVMAVLLDQYTKRGAPIDFLGHPAPSGTAIAELAIKYRLPMIPVYGTRQPDGLQVTVEFEAPISPGTAEAMTQAAADSLAARVRAHPGQYYWLHRRWTKDL